MGRALTSVVAVMAAVMVAVVVRVIFEAKEAALDEGQQRGVAAGGVRDVMRLGKCRDGQEGHADTELVKGGAIFWIGAGGIGGQIGAEFFGVVDGCVRLAEGILRTLGAGAWLETGGRVRKIGALSR